MSIRCVDFYQSLEAVLEGRANPRALAELGWHEHLLGCSACRELLEQEEALEVLLASLPDPQFPPDLSKRLLRRLRIQAQAGDSLEALLDTDRVTIPVGLHERVFAGVVARRESTLPDPLDALLDQAGQVSVPGGLAGRVLAGVRVEVEQGLAVASSAADSRSHSEGGALLQFPVRSLLWRVAAAGLIIAAGAVALRRANRQLDPSEAPGLDHVVQQVPTEPLPAPPLTPEDAEIVDHLDELLFLESLQGLGPIERDLLSQLDIGHEALLDSEGS